MRTTLILFVALPGCVGPIPECVTPDPLVRSGVRPTCVQGDPTVTMIPVCPFRDPPTDWVARCDMPESLGPRVLCETELPTCADGRQPRCEAVPVGCEGFWPILE